MQSYIINSFKKRSDNSIWVRQQEGTNSGGYTFNNQVKRLNDFICDGDFIIWSVLRTTGTTNNGSGLTGEIFTVGDRVNTNQGTHVSSLKIIMSEVILTLSGSTLTVPPSVKLQNAIKYVEQVATTKTQVTKNPVGRPKKLTTNIAFDEITQKIEQMQPIRLEKTLRKRKETLEQFLTNFFKEANNEKKTIFVDTLATQTEAGKRRSLGDIYMICKYYYPNTTLNDVLKLLYNVLPTKITTGFRTSICSTIKKRVWYYSTEGSNHVYNHNENDEYKKQVSFYTDNIK